MISRENSCLFEFHYIFSTLVNAVSTLTLVLVRQDVRLIQAQFCSLSFVEHISKDVLIELRFEFSAQIIWQGQILEYFHNFINGILDEL